MSHLNINGVDKPLDHVYVKARTENLYNNAETDWEIDILDDDGNPTGATTSHYTKNFTAVEPETAYYLSGTIYIGQSGHRIYYYDANKNWISRSVLLEYHKGNFTTPANCKYVRFQVIVDLESTSDWMLNTGSTALPYQPYLINKEAWEARDKNDHLLWGRADTFIGTSSISVRGYGLPVKSWEIDGNSQQTGTPAPDAPIYPEFVGERTKNICRLGTTTTFRGVTFTVENDGTVAVSGRITSADESISVRVSVDIYGNGDYIFSGCPEGGSNDTYYAYMWDYTVGARCKRWDGTTSVYNETGLGQQVKIVSGHAVGYCIRVTAGVTYENLVFKPMIRKRSESSDFEPYGYKIPITCAGQTKTVYLGQTPTERKIYKYTFTGQESDWRITGTGRIACVLPTTSLKSQAVPCICSHYIGVGTSTIANINHGECSTNTPANEFIVYDTNYTAIADFKTWLSQQYTSGTPVTIWYVLATKSTGIVNEPLAKIGDYVDTLTSEQSGITILTTDGNNIISVDTNL